MQNDLFDTQIPDGFNVELKESLPHDQGNLCRFCDARPLCQNSEWCEQHPCMSYNRTDGKSVVFKHIAERINHE